MPSILMVRRRVSAVSNHEGPASGHHPSRRRCTAPQDDGLGLVRYGYMRLLPVKNGQKEEPHPFRFFAFTAIAAAAVRFSTPSLA
jgi:hypothetical protein